MTLPVPDKKNIWKVFIPSQILSCTDGNLFGTVLFEEKIICVKSKDGKRSQMVGTWTSSTSSKSTPKFNTKLWINLMKSNTGELSCCLITNNSNPSFCQCILYDPDDLLSSYILSEKSNVLRSNIADNQPLSSFSENLSMVVSCLLNDSKVPGINPDQTKKHDQMIVKSCGFFYLFCEFVFHPFITILLLLGKIVDNRYTQTGIISTCLDGPALTCHLRRRLYNLRHCLNDRNNSPVLRLRFLDMCGGQVLDSVLGVCLLVVLVNGALADTTAWAIMSWADNVVTSLTQLINWMMGAPAGLKLNSQLTHFLGHFFLYHIYLWTGYLSLLRPALGVMLQCSSLLGVVGLSAQICLLKDIISMMTVHIYCFYVYAARLYSLQVYGLSSLWRLFRGKKWNVLRHRVDSAAYDIDQLFVGTLIFTILLFLLPTTLLYYVFFLVLRMVVLVVEGILSCCVRVINHVPIYSVLMWLIGSNTVAGDVVFTVVPGSVSDRSLVLTMQPTQLPVGQLLKQLHNSTNKPVSSNSLGSIINKMVKGQLIYPWIQESIGGKKKEA